MRANLVLLILLSAGILAAQPGKPVTPGNSNNTTASVVIATPVPLPIKPGPPSYPGEPPYKAYYRAAASYHADAVTSAVDRIKAFQSSPRFADAFTSPAVAQEFGDLVTSATEARLRMEHDLLTTATEVEQLAVKQLEVIQSMRQYRD